MYIICIIFSFDKTQYDDDYLFYLFNSHWFCILLLRLANFKYQYFFTLFNGSIIIISICRYKVRTSNEIHFLIRT